MNPFSLSERYRFHRTAYFDPVSAGIGVGGLLLQNQANQDAKKAQNKASGKQSELIKRQTALFDQIQSIVQGYDKSGGFDPEKQIEQLGKDTEYYAQRDIGNTAGAARNLGYRPGDSAPLKQIRSVDSAYKLQYGQRANEIRRSAFAEKLGAYRAIDPSQLNPGIQSYGQQSQMAQGQQGGFGSIAGAIQPFLGAGKPSVNLGLDYTQGGYAPGTFPRIR